jgi:SAM-dependent methyltransferase
MDWARGYVTDISYDSHGFFREMAPGYMALAALVFGRSPERLLQAERYLELGCGTGFGLALLAAANPQITFEGVDFNPSHVSYARRLIKASGLENISVMEASFEELAARSDRAEDMDIIALHGVLTWIGKESQDAIVSVARQRLRPDGFLYVSYNCIPGWTTIEPLRRLMVDVKRHHPGGSTQQVVRAIEMLNRLKEGGARYFSANPSTKQYLEAMQGKNQSYLAHEYLNDHWHIFPFSDVAAMFAQAKLSYLGSATLLENIDSCAIPPELQDLVSEAPDRIMRETLIDYASNKAFRRDIYMRGEGRMTNPEFLRLIDQLSFASLVPQQAMATTVPGPLGVLAIPEQCTPLFDRLVKGHASLEDFLALPAFKDEDRNNILNRLSLYIQAGMAHLARPLEEVDTEPAKRFNRMIIEGLEEGRIYQHLAAPMVGTGIPVTELALFTLSALFKGKTTAAEAAKHALKLTKTLGYKPTRNNERIEDENEVLEHFEINIGPILEHAVPVWRSLGVI